MIKRSLLKLSIMIFCLSLPLVNTTNAVFTDSAQINNSRFTTGDWTAPSVPGLTGWTSEIPPVGNFATGEDLDNYITCGDYWPYDYISNVWGASTDEVSGLSHYIRRVYYKPTEPDVFALIYTNNHQIGEYASQASGIPEGIYEVEIAAVDIYDNQSDFSPRCRLTVDKTSPVVNISQPSDGDVVQGVVDIWGSVEDENLSHYNIAIYPGGVDVWDFSQRLGQQTVHGSEFSNQSIYQWDTTGYPDGEYQIRLAARDLAGNRDPMSSSGDGVSTHVIVVNVNNPPSVPVLEWPINDEVTSDNTPLMQWSDSADVDGIKGYRYRIYIGSPDGSVWPDPIGSFVINSELQAGTTSDNDYYWQVRAEDNNGNLSDWSGPEHFTIDTTPEVASEVNEGDVVINEVYKSGNNQEEWVEIYNKTDGNISLKDWTIEDNAGIDILGDYQLGSKKFGVIVTQYTKNSNLAFISDIETKGAVVIVLEDDTIGNGLNEAGGDHLIFRDSSGTDIDKMSYGNDITALDPAISLWSSGSIARDPLGTDNDISDDWKVLSVPNPGSNPHSHISVDLGQDGNNLFVSLTNATGFNQIKYQVNYKHILKDKEINEFVKGEVDKDIDENELKLEPIYFGTCSSQGMVCTPHTGISNVKISLMYKKDQEIIGVLNLEFDWKNN